MATGEQIQLLLDRLIPDQMFPVSPTEFQKRIEEANYGIGAALRFLYFSEEPVITAGRISAHLGISTARTAVLLKKMEAKGLIERKTDSGDARKAVIMLSDSGRRAAEKMRENLCAHFGRLIDAIGMERLLEFAAIANEIHEITRKECLEKGHSLEGCQ